MRSIIKSLLCSLPLALCIASCEGVDYEGNYNQGFSAEKQSRMVYFYHSEGVDSINYSFSFEPHSKREHTIQVPVRIAGTMPKAALKYKVMLDASKSYVSTPQKNGNEVVLEKKPITTEYYEALNETYTVEAGKVEATLPVKFKRDAITGGQIVHFVLRLQESSDLGVGFAKGREIRLVVSNEIPQGYKEFWTTTLAPFYGVGAYSDQKFLKLLEYYDSNIDRLNADVFKPTFFLNLGKLYDYFHKEHPELGQADFNYDLLKNVLPYL